jgi:hypothetical protein
MRFTPTAFMGSAIGGELIATAIGATSGSFTSGSINYGFIKFATGSFNLNVAGGANVDLLLVAGGGGGFTGSLNAGNGGGGAGVDVIPVRLLRGNYNVIVGEGGTANENGKPTALSAYNLLYYVSGGFANGTSGEPQFNSPGADSGNCGGSNNTAGGGGGGASATGSSAFCPPSLVPNGANGGEGLTFNFDGTASVYGSGGGGGSAANPFAQGGTGGTNAGNGAKYNDNATNATNGFGGGGGGDRAGNPNVGARGGNGTLIIRYQIQ